MAARDFLTLKITGRHQIVVIIGGIYRLLRKRVNCQNRFTRFGSFIEPSAHVRSISYQLSVIFLLFHMRRCKGTP